MKGYTYLVGWSKHSLFYYGVRFAEGCSPDDLWKTYFTSSERVTALREQLGEPDIREIRKEFGSKSQAMKWEEKVLRRMKVVGRDDFLNQSLVGPFDWTGRKRGTPSEDHRRKLSEANSGKKLSEEQKRKISESLKGKKKTAEHSRKVSLANKGKQMRLGQKNSAEHKKKIAESMRRYHAQKKAV